MVSLLIAFLAELTNLIPEYIVLMNSKEKTLHHHFKSCAVVGALEDLVSLFEIISGCRDGKANWRSIFQVGLDHLEQLLCGEQGLQ